MQVPYVCTLPCGWQHRPAYFSILGKGADATAPLHFIPMHVCGPFLDDYSTMSVVCLIARKSEVTALVKEVVQLHRVAVWARLLYGPH